MNDNQRVLESLRDLTLLLERSPNWSIAHGASVWMRKYTVRPGPQNRWYFETHYWWYLETHYVYGEVTVEIWQQAAIGATRINQTRFTYRGHFDTELTLIEQLAAWERERYPEQYVKTV